jgi:hypothetical protein
VLLRGDRYVAGMGETIKVYRNLLRKHLGKRPNSEEEEEDNIKEFKTEKK